MCLRNTSDTYLIHIQLLTNFQVRNLIWVIVGGGGVALRCCRDATSGKKVAGGDRRLAAMADDVAD